MNKLSVVIPTFNRLEKLQKCIAALGCQSCGADQFDVIVVVDGSADGTAEYLDTVSTPFGLEYHVQPNSGRSAARNLGAEKANGDYLVFLDDDIVATPELLAEHLRQQVATDGVIALGKIILEPDGQLDWYARAFAHGWNRHYERLEGAVPSWLDLYSGNFSMPRTTFLEAGGFSRYLPKAEDIELGWRLGSAGARFVYAPAAAGIHTDCKSQRALIADARQVGAARFALSRCHPGALADLTKEYDMLAKPQRLLFQLLCGLGLSSDSLGFLRWLLPGRLLRYRLHKILQQHSYWMGIRDAMESESAGQWRVFSRGVPILMYHAFADTSEPDQHYIVSRARFERQMQWLRRHNYRVIPLRQMMQMRLSGRLPPPRSVVLTIDDGYRDVLSVAWPILQRLGFTATIFLVTQPVGATNSWDSTGELCERDLLSWDDARVLLDGGVEIGAHTRTHPRLSDHSAAEVGDEIRGSWQDIRQNLDIEPTAFCYPYGDYDPQVRQAVLQSEFSCACSINDGLNNAAVDDYLLQRTEITGQDSQFLFALKVRSGLSRFKLKRIFGLI